MKSINSGRSGFIGLTMLFALAGCAPMPLDHDAVPMPGIPVAGIPAEAPSIRGRITQMPSVGRLLIEANPSQPSGSDKAAVQLVAGARVLYRDGRPATVSDLSLGKSVSAWFVGPVRKSYPLQADARLIVIEP